MLIELNRGSQLTDTNSLELRNIFLRGKSVKEDSKEYEYPVEYVLENGLTKCIIYKASF
jgi:hypothetical protein